MKRKTRTKILDEDEGVDWGDEKPKRKGKAVKHYVVIPLADAKRRLLDHLGLPS